MMIKKRVFDLVLVIIFIIIALPIMLLIALAVKITSKGPIFFKADMVGYKNKPFKMFKFRTMIVGDHKEAHKKILEKINSDEDGVVDQYFDYIKKRATPIGIFLRASGLDELPQLFNILLGQMSLVGPRPAPAYEIETYAKKEYKKRLDIPPGLTGVAKVESRVVAEDFEKCIQRDLWYVKNYSILLDIKIIFKTFDLVLFNREAY